MSPVQALLRAADIGSDWRRSRSPLRARCKLSWSGIGGVFLLSLRHSPFRIYPSHPEQCRLSSDRQSAAPQNKNQKIIRLLHPIDGLSCSLTRDRSRNARRRVSKFYGGRNQWKAAKRIVIGARAEVAPAWSNWPLGSRCRAGLSRRPTPRTRYGFQPIVVFDGDGRMIAAIRGHWPSTAILLRGDSLLHA